MLMQSRKWTKFAMLAILGLWASSQVGCAGKYTGGGFIDSVEGAPQKATFGFNINGIDQNGDGYPDVATGQFQYDDHGAGVSFHVDQIEPTGLYVGISNPGDFMIVYNGSYSSKDGDGDVWIAVGAKGDGTDGLHNSYDYVFVLVFTGPYASYENAGVVQGGNIQFHPPN
jgi:hypothetical protein